MSKYPLPSEAQDQRPGLKPPQFGLRTLLVVMAGLAVTLVVFRMAGPLVAFASILLILTVMAHVFGNALGTSLRDQKPMAREHVPQDQPLQAEHFAPITRLSLRQPMGWFLMVLSGGGAIAGAYFGGNLLARINQANLTSGSMGLAIFSCAVLGGIAGFLFFSFAKVVLQAIWQAHQESD